jgi:hypothetical protein
MHGKGTDVSTREEKRSHYIRIRGEGQLLSGQSQYRGIVLPVHGLIAKSSEKDVLQESVHQFAPTSVCHLDA